MSRSLEKSMLSNPSPQWVQVWWWRSIYKNSYCARNWMKYPNLHRNMFVTPTPTYWVSLEGSICNYFLEMEWNVQIYTGSYVHQLPHPLGWEGWVLISKNIILLGTECSEKSCMPSPSPHGMGKVMENSVYKYNILLGIEWKT